MDNCGSKNIEKQKSWKYFHVKVITWWRWQSLWRWQAICKCRWQGNSDKLRKLKISTLFFPTGAFHSKMCAQASLHDLAWHNEKRNYPIYMLKWQEIAKKYETGIIRLIFWVNKKRMEYSSPVIGFMDEMCRKKAESSTKVKHNLSDLVLDISHDFWGNIREESSLTAADWWYL